MDFSEYQQTIVDDISVSTSDAFYTTAVIKRAINRAYKFIAGLKPWPATEQAYKRNAEAGKTYYNYPTNFKTDSISRLKYNGKKYTKTVWNEYQNYLEENPTGTDKLFSDYKRQYHINATIADLVDGIEIWGQEIPASMVNSSDVTVFIGESKVEEAILKYAMSILYKKGRGAMYDRGLEEETAAIALASDAFKEMMKRQGSYQSKDGVKFKYVDLLPRRSGRNYNNSRRGNFGIRG